MLEIEQLLKQQYGGQMPSASIVKHLEDHGITRATWKRAQDQLHKERRLDYIRNGRATSWRLVEPEPDPKHEFERDPETPARSESSESESHSEPPGSNGRIEEWRA